MSRRQVTGFFPDEKPNWYRNVTNKSSGKVRWSPIKHRRSRELSALRSMKLVSGRKKDGKIKIKIKSKKRIKS